MKVLELTQQQCHGTFGNGHRRVVAPVTDQNVGFNNLLRHESFQRPRDITHVTEFARVLHYGREQRRAAPPRQHNVGVLENLDLFLIAEALSLFNYGEATNHFKFSQKNLRKEFCRSFIGNVDDGNHINSLLR